MVCEVCKKEIGMGEGYVADTDENGNPIRFYHPWCNAIAHKLDYEASLNGEVIWKIQKGEVIVSPREG